MTNILYITNDGVLEALGQTQVLSSTGIRWMLLDYHKTPSIRATAFDIIVGRLMDYDNALDVESDHEVLRARAADFSIEKAVDQ